MNRCRAFQGLVSKGEAQGWDGWSGAKLVFARR
jgi:hypothetical protein